MSVQYAPSKLRVPDGFNNLLEGLAREVLREQPENIINFAAEYFKTQMLLRDGGKSFFNFYIIVLFPGKSQVRKNVPYTSNITSRIIITLRTVVNITL